MNKKIDEIKFDNELLKKYKVENDTLTSLCKKLDNDILFQRKYKSFLRKKDKEQLKANFNTISKSDDKYNKQISSTKKIKINNNNAMTFDETNQYKKRFC